MAAGSSRASRVLALLAPITLLALAPAPLMASVTITIINANQAGVGFNDPTSVAPVGGNSGTTLGAQRLKAFQYAADLWGALLDSDVEIRIQASFDALTCTATTGTLGSAGPSQTVMDFPNAPLSGTWYAVALANRIAGIDLVEGDTNHIRAQFNSKIGTTGCLEGASWYYGLDDNHGDQIDLVTVLLHEFGHGLGFVSFVDESSGQELIDQPDVFETHILDNATNQHWPDMTDAERQASTINTGHVVWDGLAVLGAVPSTMHHAPVLSVTAPGGLGDFTIGTASFGPELTTEGVSGALVQALDPSDATGPTTTDACSPLTNASAVAGKIALVDRGTCAFVDKAANVQAAGGLAMVVVDNTAEGVLALGGDDPTVTIPSVSVTQGDGATIRSALAGGVSVILHLDPRRFAGADTHDRMLLFAPNPVQPGSSTSHWDTSASPNLLMEPNLSADLPHAVDLTLPLLRDIGWKSETLPPAAPRDSVDASEPRAQPREVDPRP